MEAVIITHVVLSILITVFVAIDWHLNKHFAFENGWDISKCDPTHPVEIWIYFVPIINVLFGALNLKFTEMLCLSQNGPGVVLSIFVGPFGFHYSEWDDAI